jgi:hypothetical protein
MLPLFRSLISFLHQFGSIKLGLKLDVRVRKSPSKEVIRCFSIYFNASQLCMSIF